MMIWVMAIDEGGHGRRERRGRGGRRGLLILIGLSCHGIGVVFLVLSDACSRVSQFAIHNQNVKGNSMSAYFIALY